MLAHRLLKKPDMGQICVFSRGQEGLAGPDGFLCIENLEGVRVCELTMDLRTCGQKLFLCRPLELSNVNRSKEP